MLSFDEREVARRIRELAVTITVPPTSLRNTPRSSGLSFTLVAIVAAVLLVAALLSVRERPDPTPLAPPSAHGSSTVARINPGDTADLQVASNDPACEQRSEIYVQIWPCQAVVIRTPQSGSLTVEVTWSDPANTLALRVPTDMGSVYCCAPRYTLPVTAGGEVRIEVVFLNYQVAGSPVPRIQQFTLHTTMTPSGGGRP